MIGKSGNLLKVSERLKLPKESFPSMISDMERLMLEKARVRRTVHSDTNLEEPVYGIYTSFTFERAGEFQKLYSYIKPPQKICMIGQYRWRNFSCKKLK